MPSAEPLVGSRTTQSEFATGAIDNVMDQEQSKPESGPRLGLWRSSEPTRRDREKLPIHALTTIDYLQTSNAIKDIDNDCHGRPAMYCRVVQEVTQQLSQLGRIECHRNRGRRPQLQL